MAVRQRARLLDAWSHRLRVHEWDAPELVPDASLEAIFDQANQVGARARADAVGRRRGHSFVVGALAERCGVVAEAGYANTDRACGR